MPTSSPLFSEAQMLTVTQLTQAIKQQLETNFRNISLQGEISNFKMQSSGHLYFSLKDQGAQITAVMFRGDALRLKMALKDGDQVQVKGELSVYAPRGNYQIVVREMALLGIGELLMRLELLKREIKKRGWFEKEHKKPLPKFPKRIGVVTSPTGAALQDILNILTRRFSGFHLILNPVRVQGAEAPGEIAKAIRQFNEHRLADVLIVGRGGGSIEDLWAFNEEVVAAAIFESQIPIISAVGHETDHCIADYVADFRAPTPSAAAEIVLGEKAHLLQHLQQARRRLGHSLTHLVRHHRNRLDGLLRHPLLRSPYPLLGGSMQRVDDFKQKLDAAMDRGIKNRRILLNGRERQATGLNPMTRLMHGRMRLQQLDRTLQRLIRMKLDLGQERLKHLVEKLHGLDPKNILKRGYSIAFSEKDGSVITSIQDLKPDQKISLLVADGKAKATIMEVELK